jgi:hypothetical protein
MLLARGRAEEQEQRCRRLSDKIKLAFNHACDADDYITATELLAAMQLVLLRNPSSGEQRDNVLGTLYACKARIIFMSAGRVRAH